ncbi:hypothetical protein AWR27_14850 [Spirosoma montaniterrae]|uniref:Uncharacterized protein n=1 Tax=Spirosoma montaniterrae TaxID=1178516 RepID=A0A1P9WYP8_9BACT|nr:hypothetical protein AWR27_14850 [Spirosoma montaniterrae]
MADAKETQRVMADAKGDAKGCVSTDTIGGRRDATLCVSFASAIALCVSHTPAIRQGNVNLVKILKVGAFLQLIQCFDITLEVFILA